MLRLSLDVEYYSLWGAEKKRRHTDYESGHYPCPACRATKTLTDTLNLILPAFPANSWSAAILLLSNCSCSCWARVKSVTPPHPIPSHHTHIIQKPPWYDLTTLVNTFYTLSPKSHTSSLPTNITRTLRKNGTDSPLFVYKYLSPAHQYSTTLKGLTNI